MVRANLSINPVFLIIYSLIEKSLNIKEMGYRSGDRGINLIIRIVPWTD